MSLVDRINAWVVGAVRPPDRVRIGPDGLRWSAQGAWQSAEWSRVRRVAAHQRGAGLDREPVLAFEFEDGGVLELPSSLAGWEALVEGLGAFLPLEASTAAWRTRLLSDERASVLLFDRSGSHPSTNRVSVPS